MGSMVPAPIKYAVPHTVGYIVKKNWWVAFFNPFTLKVDDSLKVNKKHVAL